MQKIIYRIETCIFWRKQNGPQEWGLLLNNGEEGIIDHNGVIVPKVWDWRRTNGFVLDLDGLKALALNELK